MLFLTGCGGNNGFKSLETKGVLSNKFFDDFKTPEYIDDNYMLNLDEDESEFFIDNLVEAHEFAKTSSVNITVNNNALVGLSKMYKEEDYDNLIVRRGYVECKHFARECVVDHRTGYDVDFYVKDKEWTDFEVYDEAKHLIENSYKYGFVLRYVSKDDYQPWHYRYIGETHSNIINNEGITIEEYISKLKPGNVYNVKGTNKYVYKVHKDDLVIPSNYNYSISSVSKDYYVVDVDTTKSLVLKEIDMKENIVEKELKSLEILYDLILVNENYAVPNIPNKNTVSITNYLSDDNDSDYFLNETVLQKLKPMLEESNSLDRHITYVTSSYRTAEKQKELYDDAMVSGEVGFVLPPSYSEHETGLAFDLSNSYKSHTKFTSTTQGLWIKENAHKYGFILRYPADKTSITGIRYEPWHFRYVGELHSSYMEENKLAFEEYLDMFELNVYYEINYNNKKRNYPLTPIREV